MEGLPPTDLYIGTRDVFHPDALRLRDALEDAGVTVRHHEAVGAFHVYPLVPCAEGYRARRWILATLRGL
jgi:acetyl esterase/lipase